MEKVKTIDAHKRHNVLKMLGRWDDFRVRRDTSMMNFYKAKVRNAVSNIYMIHLVFRKCMKYFRQIIRKLVVKRQYRVKLNLNAIFMALSMKKLIKRRYGKKLNVEDRNQKRI